MQEIVFDLDGTLVHSLPGIARSVESALTTVGIHSRVNDLNTLIGPPIRVILSRVSGLREESKLNLLEQAFRTHYDSKGWRETTAFPGVVDVLTRAKQEGLRLFVATNKPKAATNAILDGLRLRTYFDDVICRDSVTPPFESKAAMLAYLLTRNSIQAANCLLVGDTTEDIDAGAAVGINTIVVTHGYGGTAIGSRSTYATIDHFDQLVI